VRNPNAERQAIIARATRGLPKVAVARKPGSFWVATLRGIVLGLVILVVLYYARAYQRTHKLPWPPSLEEKGASGMRMGSRGVVS
jgi:hypothetical protein